MQVCAENNSGRVLHQVIIFDCVTINFVLDVVGAETLAPSAAVPCQRIIFVDAMLAVQLMRMKRLAAQARL